MKYFDLLLLCYFWLCSPAATQAVTSVEISCLWPLRKVIWKARTVCTENPHARGGVKCSVGGGVFNCSSPWPPWSQIWIRMSLHDTAASGETWGGPFYTCNTFYSPAQPVHSCEPTFHMSLWWDLTCSVQNGDQCQGNLSQWIPSLCLLCSASSSEEQSSSPGVPSSFFRKSEVRCASLPSLGACLGVGVCLSLWFSIPAVLQGELLSLSSPRATTVCQHHHSQATFTRRPHSCWVQSFPL